MELTLKEKEKVFSMYYGQEVAQGGALVNNLLSLLLMSGGKAYATLGLELNTFSEIKEDHAFCIAELIMNEKLAESEGRKLVIDDGYFTVFWSEVKHTGVDNFGFRYSLKVYRDLFVMLPGFKGHTQMNYDAYLYLISKGYAVPLFFEPNHWANGKTAIELNIATNVHCRNGQPVK